jgi:glutamate dehydrogenase
MTRTTGAVPAIPVPAPADDGTPVAATDLAALEAERDEKRRRLERAARTALEGASGLPPGCGADDVPALLRRYYWSEPAAEVLDHDPADLAALALRHLRLAEVRPEGAATVDVQELPARDGAGPRALVLVVTDDMPFLVDSVTAEVASASSTSSTRCWWSAAT